MLDELAHGLLKFAEDFNRRHQLLRPGRKVIVTLRERVHGEGALPAAGSFSGGQSMPSTVNAAFDEFMKDSVNLTADSTAGARRSRDWLLEQVRRFPEKEDDFPLLYTEQDIAFGSFARRTKTRELDDVDLIVCLSATGGTYMDWGFAPITLTVPLESRLSRLCNSGTQTLNSKKVVNRLVKALYNVPQYSSADVNRRGEAAVLRLSSYTWSFDMVPGFFTKPDGFGRTYYLIPDGDGNWKKTDPRIDGNRVSAINQAHDGNVLNVVRAMKFWNRRPTKPTVGSYLFEVIVLDHFEGRTSKASQWIDLEVGPVLRNLASVVVGRVRDPKGIQNDLNNLTWEQRYAIRERALLDATRAEEARSLETQGEHRKSIGKWREVFGDLFPEYS